jgi:hypothetical protein
MSRAIPARSVSGEGQGEPLAIAPRKFVRTKQGRNRRGGVAALGPDGTADVAGLAAACRAPAEARLVRQAEDQIRRVVDAAPPLTAEQLDTLAVLLRGRTAHGDTDIDRDVTPNTVADFPADEGSHR